jgi:phage baseplate assembly protein gpV
MYPINNSKSFSVPRLGDWVVGFFMDGDSGQAPIMMGVLPGIQK